MSRHWLNETDLAGDTFGACLPYLLCSWAPIAFCPVSLVQDSDPIFKLTCNPLWIAFYENNMRQRWGRQTNLKAGWKKAIGDTDGGSRRWSGGRGTEERRGVL